MQIDGPPYTSKTWNASAPFYASTLRLSDRYRLLGLFTYHTRVRATPDTSAVIGPAG